MQQLAISTFFTILSLASCQHQQQIDPAYLQQYYAQVAQAAGAARSGAIATPIYEQENSANQQPQYIAQAQAQQIRVKDTVQEQVKFYSNKYNNVNDELYIVVVSTYFVRYIRRFIHMKTK